MNAEIPIAQLKKVDVTGVPIRPIALCPPEECADKLSRMG